MAENTDSPEPIEPDSDCSEECEPSGTLLFFDYLESEKGHQIVSRILTILEDLKKAGIEKSSRHLKFDRILQVSIIFSIIVATSVLTWFGKFDSTVAVLFGTLVGYLFGKRGA